MRIAGAPSMGMARTRMSLKRGRLSSPISSDSKLAASRRGFVVLLRAVEVVESADPYRVRQARPAAWLHGHPAGLSRLFETIYRIIGVSLHVAVLG